MSAFSRCPRACPTCGSCRRWLARKIARSRSTSIRQGAPSPRSIRLWSGAQSAAESSAASARAGAAVGTRRARGESSPGFSGAAEGDGAGWTVLTQMGPDPVQNLLLAPDCVLVSAGQDGGGLPGLAVSGRGRRVCRSARLCCGFPPPGQLRRRSFSTLCRRISPRCPARSTRRSHGSAPGTPSHEPLVSYGDRQGSGPLESSCARELLGGRPVPAG
jgi:hypothetical protein